ncbi:MAG: DNA primase DnaG [Candidatus Burarchaeum sp.]|nr:DNA primase DnaG [Candidatus Burarchaeum sp.]MDO8340118.1 DNA primase DnaG [Candidatus Burarchaeum sp.]
MGKTYIDTVKYVVYSEVEIGGMIEKPDVVGALFGQTEGLLGDELDLRELQKNGRIGRIEVDLHARAGKTQGTIQLPSSLDMVETCILAAALETVDRVGPYTASIKVQKIEDTRSVKRKTVVDRAKFLLKNLLVTEIPESGEISELVRAEVRVSEILEFGPDKLPAGPGVQDANEILVVEGRADVLNLLKNNMDNAVAIGGANVPKSLAALCKQKEVTLFLDGDRGGDIIMKEIMSIAEVDYVARAPAGKEVEELSRKELIKALRSRVPVEQSDGEASRQESESSRAPFRLREPVRPSLRSEVRSMMGQPHVAAPAQRMAAPMPSRMMSSSPLSPASQHVQAQPMQQAVAPAAFQRPAPAPIIPTAQVAMPSVSDELYASLAELENTARAKLYDEGNALKSEILVKDILPSLESASGVHSVVFDGVVTQRLVDLAAKKGIKILLGVKVGNIFNRPPGMFIGAKK